jgi:hypothetical protein
MLGDLARGGIEASRFVNPGPRSVDAVPEAVSLGLRGTFPSSVVVTSRASAEASVGQPREPDPRAIDAQWPDEGSVSSWSVARAGPTLPIRFVVRRQMTASSSLSGPERLERQRERSQTSIECRGGGW